MTTPNDDLQSTDSVQEEELVEAAKLRDAILEGYQDAIEGRTVVYQGNLRELLVQDERTSG